MPKRLLGNSALLTLAFSYTCFTQVALAQSASSSTAPATTGASAANATTVEIASDATKAVPEVAPSTTGSAPLEGGVQKIHVSLESLKTVGLDLKNLLKGASSLYDEVTIQPVSLITEPEVIGRGMVINIPIGTQPVGPPTPARKARVDLAMSHITPTVAMLKSNVDGFVSGHKQLDLPDNIITLLKPQLTAWVQTVDTIADQESQLEASTKTAPYDQKSIADSCVALEKSIKDLDETRRSVYKVLRKHGKELKQQ